jgi:hypothetical protein
MHLPRYFFFRFLVASPLTSALQVLLANEVLQKVT